MRIISGKYRHKKLLDSTKLHFRPTTDRSRESLFNILENSKFIKEQGFAISGCNVLDVCCGTGAVSFEFLSRGGASAFLIDSDSTHLEFAKKNAAALTLQSQCQFLLCDVTKPMMANKQKFDVVFFDPPYAQNYALMLQNLVEKNWISDESLVIIEFDAKKKIDYLKLESFSVLKVRSYGKSAFAFCVV